MRNALIVLLALVLGGCTGYKAGGLAFKPLTPVSNDQAQVYVYVLPGQGIHGYALTVDGEKVAVIGRGAYYGVLLDPGPVEIATELEIPSWQPAVLTRALSGEKKLTIDAKAGETYYVRGVPSENGERNHLSIALVEASVGSAEVTLLRLPE